MGTIKEVCWSTKFRKQQKLMSQERTKSSDDPPKSNEDPEQKNSNQNEEDDPKTNQNSEPSKIPRRIRKSKTDKQKLKIDSEIDKPPSLDENKSKTELKRGSELSQVSVVLTSRESEAKIHCSKDCIDSQCITCHPKKCPEAKPQKAKEKRKESCCDKSKRKPVKCKRSRPNSSVSALNQNLRTNCCACCGLLLDYFNEVIRLLSCKCDTRVNEAFCELCEVASCLCSDCLTLLKKLFCCLGSVCNKKQKKGWL